MINHVEKHKTRPLSWVLSEKHFQGMKENALKNFLEKI